jgi:hypothetical protein
VLVVAGGRVVSRSKPLIKPKHIPVAMVVAIMVVMMMNMVKKGLWVQVC